MEAAGGEARHGVAVGSGCGWRRSSGRGRRSVAEAVGGGAQLPFFSSLGQLGMRTARRGEARDESGDWRRGYEGARRATMEVAGGSSRSPLFVGWEWGRQVPVAEAAGGSARPALFVGWEWGRRPVTEKGLGMRAEMGLG